MNNTKPNINAELLNKLASLSSRKITKFYCKLHSFTGTEADREMCSDCNSCEDCGTFLGDSIVTNKDTKIATCISCHWDMKQHSGDVYFCSYPDCSRVGLLTVMAVIEVIKNEL